MGLVCILFYMGKAARAIIVVGDKTLVMHRNKYGSQYFTLVGGQVSESETTEQALVREVKEETGLDITSAQLVFIEKHKAPYNEQYIYLCQIGPAEQAAIQEGSEEEILNRYQMNIHKLQWVQTYAFDSLPFRTPQLHAAIVKGFKEGFPDNPVEL